MWMLTDIRCVRMVLFYACYCFYVHTCIHISDNYKILCFSCVTLWTLWVIHWITWRVPSPVRPTLPRHLWGELWSRRQLMVNTYKNHLTWTWHLPLIPLGLWFPLIQLIFWVYECLPFPPFFILLVLEAHWKVILDILRVEIPRQAIAYRVAAVDVNVRCSYVGWEAEFQSGWMSVNNMGRNGNGWMPVNTYIIYIHLYYTNGLVWTPSPSNWVDAGTGTWGNLLASNFQAERMESIPRTSCYIEAKWLVLDKWMIFQIPSLDSSNSCCFGDGVLPFQADGSFSGGLPSCVGNPCDQSLPNNPTVNSSSDLAPHKRWLFFKRASS